MLAEPDESREDEVERLKSRITTFEGSFETYRRIFDISPIGMAISALGGEILDVNASALRLFGMSRGEVIGRTALELDLFEPESEDEPSPLSVRVQEQGTVSNTRRTLRSRLGALRDVALLVDRIEFQGRPGYISTFLDVTEQTRAVALLAASEARYRLIVETTREGICIWDADDRYTFVNGRFNEMFGYAPGEILGKHMLELMSEEDRAPLVPLQTRRRAGIGEGGEVRIRRTTGEVMWLKFESSPILDEAGRYAGALATMLDVTERWLAEDLLRRSEIQLREAQEIAQVGSWEWDLRTNIITRSDELRRIYGMTAEQLRRPEDGSFELIHPDDRVRLREAVQGAIARGESSSVDYRIVRPDGVRYIHGRGQVICDESGTPIRALGTAQDVTDRKQIEARLAHADRMASVGILAAGVAHEINNPLAYILSNLELVAEALAERTRDAPSEQLGELATRIAEARQGGERVRKIVRGLKAFSRADEDRRVVVDVRKVLDAAINMVFGEIRHRARLVKDYQDVPPVEADESNLVQVFVNLLVNAAQSLPEGQADRHEIGITTRTHADGRALVEIRDTGPGMSREVLGRIFDPFFTTKPIGVGTGLGLSICHGMITALGGEIAVESEPGRGAFFRITLPRAQRTEVEVKIESESESASKSASESESKIEREIARETPAVEAPSVAAPTVAEKRGRILVVDDDAMVGQALRRILRVHDVMVVNHAREAWSRIAAGARYDLILCDLMMPEMTGMELHAEVLREAPEQAARIIFVTGGAFTPSAVEFLAQVTNEKIDKPFESKSLRALVQQLLS